MPEEFQDHAQHGECVGMILDHEDSEWMFTHAPPESPQRPTAFAANGVLLPPGHLSREEPEIALSWTQVSKRDL